jgi:hypothetical protein
MSKKSSNISGITEFSPEYIQAMKRSEYEAMRIKNEKEKIKMIEDIIDIKREIKEIKKYIFKKRIINESSSSIKNRVLSNIMKCHTKVTLSMWQVEDHGCPGLTR